MDDLSFETLSAVASLGPSKATGAAIWDRLDEARGLHHSSGEIYTTLHKMRDVGYLAAERRDDRVYYSVTTKGRAAHDKATEKRQAAGAAPAFA